MQLLPQVKDSRLLVGNEGMERKMEATTSLYIKSDPLSGIPSLIPCEDPVRKCHASVLAGSLP